MKSLSTIMTAAFQADDQQIMHTTSEVYRRHIACRRSGYFDIMKLRSEEDVDHTTLKRRRNALMLEYHPDKRRRHCSADADMAIRINEAFRELSSLVDAVENIVRKYGRTLQSPTRPVSKEDLLAVCEIVLKAIVTAYGANVFVPEQQLRDMPQIAMLFPQKQHRDTVVQKVMEALCREGYCSTLFLSSSSSTSYSASSKARIKARSKRYNFQEVATFVRFA